MSWDGLVDAETAQAATAYEAFKQRYRNVFHYFGKATETAYMQGFRDGKSARHEGES